MPEKVFNMVKEWDHNRGIEDSRRPPYHWYTDPDFYKQEVATIFQRLWLPVARLDQLQEPGDYVAGEICGNPYVVVRDLSGKLHAHHNVCRHAGAIVAKHSDEGQHRCQEFQCPFHGWQYNLDGTLKKAPMLGKQKAFEPKRYGLFPIMVDTWGPYAFIDLDGPFDDETRKPRDLANDTKEIDGFLAQTDWGNLRFYKRFVFEMNCNWKVFVDNSLDGGYHVKYAHEGLAEGLDMSKFETHVYPRSSIQVCDTVGKDKRLGDKVMYAYLFPNIFVNRYGNMMDVNIVEPIGVDKCRVIFDFFFDYEDFHQWDVKKKIHREIAASHVIQDEDIEICEDTQKGMRSMNWRHGRYSSVLEQAAYAFHVTLCKEMRGWAE